MIEYSLTRCEECAVFGWERRQMATGVEGHDDVTFLFSRKKKNRPAQQMIWAVLERRGSDGPKETGSAVHASA